jgi:hypothetical protein
MFKNMFVGPNFSYIFSKNKNEKINRREQGRKPIGLDFYHDADTMLLLCMALI